MRITALIVAIGCTIGSLAGPAPAGAAQEGESPSAPGRGTTSPRVLREVKPQYTDEAKAARIEGLVAMDVVVLENGTVGDVTVTRSLDAVHGLDEQAVKAMKQWTFDPGRRDGKAVPVLVSVEMTFTLK